MVLIRGPPIRNDLVLRCYQRQRARTFNRRAFRWAPACTDLPMQKSFETIFLARFRDGLNPKIFNLVCAGQFSRPEVIDFVRRPWASGFDAIFGAHFSLHLFSDVAAIQPPFRAAHCIDAQIPKAPWRQRQVRHGRARTHISLRRIDWRDQKDVDDAGNCQRPD